MLTGQALAVGVVPYLGEVALAPAPPTVNGVTNLAPALAYARDHGFDVELATWPTLVQGDLPPWPSA